MSVGVRRKIAPPESLEEKYASLLSAYAAGGGESALGQAYAIGRRAITEQKSLIDIVSAHHRALQLLVADAKDEKRKKNVLRSSADFLAECLSPYEMAHRGFQDAVNALRRLNETLEEEIKRIAYAVHDEAGQLLVAVYLALSELSQELPAQQEQIKRIEGLLKEVEIQLRRYSHELRPTILDDLGWIPAIRFLAEAVSKRASLLIHFDTSVSGRLPGILETAVYRIVQEALNNAVKHAKAKNVWIRAWQTKQKLYCSIQDDGAGFPRNKIQLASRKGLGLVAMRERVSALGGTLRVESYPAHGSKLTIQIPLEEDHGNPRSHRR